MFIELDLDSDVALYEQLKNCIIEGIATNKLKEGDILPSMRQLASQLSINTLTVNKAYNQLKQDGFLTINRRKNVVVNDKQKFKASQESKKKLYEQIRPLLIEAKARDMSDKELLNTCSIILKSLTEG